MCLCVCVVMLSSLVYWCYEASTIMRIEGGGEYYNLVFCVSVDVTITNKVLFQTGIFHLIDTLGHHKKKALQ